MIFIEFFPLALRGLRRKSLLKRHRIVMHVLIGSFVQPLTLEIRIFFYKHFPFMCSLGIFLLWANICEFFLVSMIFSFYELFLKALLNHFLKPLTKFGKV